MRKFIVSALVIGTLMWVGCGDDGDGGDPTVLCTALYNLRDLDEEIYMADVEGYVRRKVLPL